MLFITKNQYSVGYSVVQFNVHEKKDFCNKCTYRKWISAISQSGNKKLFCMSVALNIFRALSVSIGIRWSPTFNGCFQLGSWHSPFGWSVVVVNPLLNRSRLPARITSTVSVPYQAGWHICCFSQSFYRCLVCFSRYSRSC